jgi:hypothetical protein
MRKLPAEHGCTAVQVPTHRAGALAPAAPVAHARGVALARERASASRIIAADRRKRLGVRRDTAAADGAVISLLCNPLASEDADLLWAQ